jgi:hypothetical protein
MFSAPLRHNRITESPQRKLWRFDKNAGAKANWRSPLRKLSPAALSMLPSFICR